MTSISASDPVHDSASAAASLQYSRPRLKSGQIFGSLVATTASEASSFLYELSDGSRQVSLPAEAIRILPLLDGTKTIPDILEDLHRSDGRVPFKTFFSTVQKLQTHGCLDGAELLVTSEALKRVDMFERENLWLTRPLYTFRLSVAKIMGEPSVLAFVLFAIGTLIITLSFVIGAIALGLVTVPNSFLRIQESYVKGLLFFFVAASLLITAKTLIKTILSLLLTGARSALSLELGLYSLAVKSRDDKIYMAGGRALGTLAFFAIASSYFFVFAIASAVAPHWARLDDLFWTSAILALIDLNPFRKSDLSSFFNIVYNQHSAVELLPYFKNRGIISLKTSGIADTAIYTAYTTLALAWTMIAYNVLLALITRNDSTLVSTLLQTWREGPFAEFVAAFILAAGLAAALIYLVFDLCKTVMTNILFPRRSQRLSQRSRKQGTADTLQNTQELARSIEQVPLFTGLHPDAILFLIGKGQARKFSKGAHIIVQETASDELFILTEGEVAIRKTHATGAVQEVSRLKAPTVFGENTLLANAVRSADVVAVKDSRVIAIPRRAIDEFIHHATFRTEAETLLDRLILGQYVAASELFKGAPSEAVSLFLNEGQVVSIATGRHVIEQGRTDKDFYLLIRGSVDVIRNGEVTAHLHQGDFFGEMALILNSPRTATIMTREPCRFLKISARQFWRILSQHASIALYLETVSENRIGAS